MATSKTTDNIEKMVVPMFNYNNLTIDEITRLMSNFESFFKHVAVLLLDDKSSAEYKLSAISGYGEQISESNLRIIKRLIK